MTDLCPVHNRPYETRRGMANGIVAPHCSWDGSLHPDVFMDWLEKPGTVLTPTDKNYKVYIEVVDGDPSERRIVGIANFDKSDADGWQRFEDADLTGVDLSMHGDLSGNWIQIAERGPTREDKFYFEHLSVPQRHLFIEKLNAGELTLAYPGHFYRLPFFIA